MISPPILKLTTKQWQAVSFMSGERTPGTQWTRLGGF